MANIHSQEKRIHRAERERLENRRRTSQVKTWFRRLESAVGDGDPARADTEDTIAELGGPSADQLDAAIAGARESARAWASTPAVERAQMLHEAATRMRAMTDDLAH